MNQQEIDEILSGRRRGMGVSLLRLSLLLASLPYSVAMRLRRMAYNLGILPSRSATAPVISVGNLTTGGTGKTPMAVWVATQLKQAGAKPAVITRGYKGFDGTSDEAELLGRLTGCPVAVNPDRLAAAEGATMAGADVLVMDDGFQHRRLRRDLDIVLIDATRPFGYGRCLPRGLLREPLWALRDADAVVITRSDSIEPDRLAELRSRLARLTSRASIHQAVHRPVLIVDHNGDDIPLDSLAGKKICAFCGLGNPQPFFDQLRELRAELLCQRALDDHLHYTGEVIESLRRAASRCDADVLITTQKDAVKLAAADFGRPLWQLAVQIAITDGRDELIEKVKHTWRSGAE